VKTEQKLSDHAESTGDMVNEEFEPNDKEEDVLDVLSDEYRANPYLIREQTGLGKGDVNTALTRLTSAGWVRKITRGLYEFVDDPRDHAGGQTGDVDDRGATPTPEPTAAAPDAAVDVDVDSLDLDTQLTDERREVLLEFLKGVADRDQPVKKGDYAGEFWTDDRADRSGFQERSFWEVLAKPAMKQSDAFEKPNARAYRYSGS